MTASTPGARDLSSPLQHQQRRFLVVLFADLSRSTRLAAEMEAEDYAELLTGLRTICNDVISRHGGQIFRVQGDGLLACFGYPDVREDDARRAVEAALELHAAVRAASRPGRPLTLHSGIHAGLVLMQPGDEVSGRFVLFGNAVNIAARLADAAADDEIIASAEMLGSERHFFETDGGRSLSLPGVERTIEVWRIIARAPVANRFETRVRGGLTPFVGRASELAFLAERMSRCMAGRAQYVAIVAPPGQGKTRLMEQFLASLESSPTRVLRGYCESYLSAPPLQPFLQMLRSIAGIGFGMAAGDARERLRQSLASIAPHLAKHAPALAQALSLAADKPDEPRDPPRSTADLATSFVALFDAMAAERALLIAIDDWQWADDATRQLLAAIRELPGRAVFALVATRPTRHDGIGLAGADVVRLASFDAADADEAIRHLLRTVNTFEMAQIRDASGGNPLFIEELCRSPSGGGSPGQRSGAQASYAWLGKLIEARVERLPAEQADVVRTAAVVGNVVPARLLEALTGCGPHHPLLLGLAEQDLVYPGGGSDMLRFKHGIARDVIYETVGMHHRRRLHLRIAEVLMQQAAQDGQQGVHEQLAYHFGAAGAWAEAAFHAEIAGDNAIAVSALDRAQVQYQAALTALERTELTAQSYQRWLAIARRLGLVSVFDPSIEQLKLFETAVTVAERFGDEGGRGHAEYWLGYIHYGLGDFRRATHYLEIALERAHRLGDVALAKWCGATLGQAYAAASQYDRALQLLGRAISDKKSQKRITRPAVGYAYSLACQASALGDRGDFNAAEQCFREALWAVEGAGHEVEGSISCWQSGVALWRGEWSLAEQSASRAQHVAEQVKSLYLYAMGRALGGYAEWMRSRRPDALQTILEATTWLERDGKALFISLNYGWLTEMMVEQLKHHGARQYAARALRRARRHDRIGGAMALRALARAARAGHRHRAASHYLALAAQNAALRQSRHETAKNLVCEAELAAADGDLSRATELLNDAAERFVALGMASHAAHARGMLAGL